MTTLHIKKLDHGKDLPLPKQGTPLSAGFDICAALQTPLVLGPGERHLIPCGFSIALPENFEAQIRPRSGLALKHGLTVLNTPGTIDADYRGEVGVCLINLGNEPFSIERGMRIAQMVIAPVATRVVMNVVEDLPSSTRSDGGWGSTGTN